MCAEYVYIKKWSEGLGRLREHRLISAPLGLAAKKTDPCTSVKLNLKHHEMAKSH